MRTFLRTSLTALHRLLTFRVEGNAPRILLASFVFTSVVGLSRCGANPPDPLPTVTPEQQISELQAQLADMKTISDAYLSVLMDHENRILKLERQNQSLECQADLLAAASRSSWGQAYRMMRAGLVERCQ